MLKVCQTRSANRLSERKEGEYLQRLPPAIRASIQRYRRWEDRQRVLLGKLLLLQALLSRNPEADDSLLEHLENTESGKPFIKGQADFNLSHSGEMVMLAVVDEGTTGIDVEKIRPIEMDDFSRVLPELFSLEAFDRPDRLKLFYATWTKKEAVLKGAGLGLLVPLDQVELEGDRAYFNDRIWTLQAIDCGPEYSAHVATSEPQAGCWVEVVDF
ncbi:MAG: 4'-phosphopantetheinyl transferase superfamily protein [Pseudomonadota bacterium]